MIGLPKCFSMAEKPLILHPGHIKISDFVMFLGGKNMFENVLLGN